MNDLAQRLNVPVINHRLVFPEAIASGSLNFIRLPNGAHVNIVNCKVNTSWLLCRRKIKEQYYTLRFHELTIPNMLEIRIGDAEATEFAAASVQSAGTRQHQLGRGISAMNVLPHLQETMQPLGWPGGSGIYNDTPRKSIG